MNKKDKEEFVGIVSAALDEVVVPALEDLEQRINKKMSSIQEDVGDLKMGVDSLNRKFDAQQERLDRHSKVQENLEKRVSNLETKMIAPQTY